MNSQRSTANHSAFKLVLLGENSVGKSSLVMRFSKGTFLDYSESTIGAAFTTQQICIDNTTIRLEIWDTAGQERYRALAPMYYRGASVAIVVYDITNRGSFERARSWVTELKNQGSQNVMIYLVGNKCDIESDREVSTQEGEDYCQEASLQRFFETSAKCAINVNELFVKIAKDLAQLPTPPPSTKHLVQVEKPKSYRTKYCGCN